MVYLLSRSKLGWMILGIFFSKPKTFHKKLESKIHSAMFLAGGASFPSELLRLIIECICAPQNLQSIAAVCHEWKETTDPICRALSTACSTLRGAPFRVATPWTLQHLDLWKKQIGDTEVSILAAAIQPKEGKGALPRLKKLNLSDNNIGDAGVTALASALGQGALPLLSSLNLFCNQIGDSGLSNFVTAVGSNANGTLPLLAELILAHNQIGDVGASTFANATDPKEGEGALPSLEKLYLHYNQIGDAGVTSLATAVANGALPALTFLHLGNNNIGIVALTSLIFTVVANVKANICG